MLRNFLKNKKAQNTAEYALLIALVVAGVIAMQTYAQRALQARIHDVSQYMSNATSNSSIGLGNSTQYEPYYLSSKYDSTKNATDTTHMDNTTLGYNAVDNSLRNGVQVSNYTTGDMNQTL